MGAARDMRSWLYPLIAALMAVILVIGMSCCRATQIAPDPTPEPWTGIATATAQARETADAAPTPGGGEGHSPLPTPLTAPLQSPLALPPSGPVMTSPDYGIQAFLWWRSEVATRDLGLITEMGFRWVKQVFAWADIEGAGKGHYNWSQADAVVQHADDYGVKLLARLDRAPAWTGAGLPNGPPTNYEDFGDFCFEVARRYRGRIQAYQIWNEPNLAREWGGQPPSPDAYTRLLAIAYRRIKEADPDAIVISAGLSPTGTSSAEVMPDTDFLTGMYRAGFQAHCDIVGMHAAGYKAPPELSPEEAVSARDGNGAPLYGGERFFCFRHVEDLRAVMEQNGDGARQVAILEFGWTTDTIHPEYAWHAVTMEQQADYLVRAYRYAEANWQPWIALMSTIYIADSDWTKEREEYWWAITYPNYPTPLVKPAYDALRDMAKAE